ncbi:hypothetical protein EDB89DRAFT_705661 [Lactarius sanguifluus]|nr:hypothetical protein EDB89DRAFT_705661 [Lactarius sanguifluus]
MRDIQRLHGEFWDGRKNRGTSWSRRVPLMTMHDVKKGGDTETDQLRLPRHRIRRVSNHAIGGRGRYEDRGEGGSLNRCLREGDKKENTGVQTGVRARLRKRALKLIGSTGRGGCIPSLRLRPVVSTKPLAPDTFKASHRRLECFLNHPLLPSPSSPTFRNPTRGAHASILILSLQHTRNSQTMFSGFLTVLFLQDFGDKTQTPLPSFRSHQWDRNQTVPAASGTFWFLPAQVSMKAQRS